MNNQFTLMRERRFWPLFVTQFLGALNNNLFKQTLSVMVAYEIMDIGAANPKILVSLAAGLFVLPFILFAPLAGGLADKYDKDKIMRVLKLVELVIVLGAIAGLFLQSVEFLLFILFVLGIQAAFFSPSKFSILPQHLHRDELIGGNALVNTGTYLAVLLGTIMGSLLALNTLGHVVVATLMLLSAVGGYVASRFIPRAHAPVPDLKLNFNVFKEAVDIIIYARRQPNGVFTAVVGCSWFFFTGATLLAQFPNYARHTLGVDNFVMTFFMVIFSLGVGLGGLLNNRLLRSRIEATFVPAAALALSIFSLDLYFASNIYDLPFILNGHDMMGIGAFLSYGSGWRIVMDLFMISLAGGLYVVPLKSIIQDRTPADHSARVLAGSALMDASLVLLSAITAMAFFALGAKVQHLFILISIGSAAASLYMLRISGNTALKKFWRKIRA